MAYITIGSFITIFFGVYDYEDDWDEGTFASILFWPLIFIVYVCGYLPMKFAKWLKEDKKEK